MVLDKKTSSITDSKYADIADYLNPGDVLVLNDTRVIKARLIAEKENGSKRELIILEKHGKDDDWYRHHIMYRRKLSVGDRLRVGEAILVVEELLDGGLAVVKSSHDLLTIADQYGEVPLPPYLHRSATNQDVDRYQTVWANEKGSVAAPTASLNMTDDILTTIVNKGVKVVFLTLHVGLGTFLPIRSDQIEEHVMHREYFHIPSSTTLALRRARAENRRIVALGTTVARTLEYAHSLLFSGDLLEISGEADIFIYPGYKFKSVDCLITNFHAPKSTVLMLTAAFAGWDKLLLAYDHAVGANYKFLSYGDSMIIL